jgi:hypothetical protein
MATTIIAASLERSQRPSLSQGRRGHSRGASVLGKARGSISGSFTRSPLSAKAAIVEGESAYLKADHAARFAPMRRFVPQPNHPAIDLEPIRKNFLR